ncbi:hypothetical protein ACFY00_25110 [Kitasatospora sp. NPDC001540]|uniref:hypothetical protein n=1 Tax=Kitasatospora sp. NPDC001540 TaxID=3364014 RepID=UPI0036841A6D
MALVVVASASGAPGASTVALAMAGVWPRDSLLAECGATGNPLVFRHKAIGGKDDLDPRVGMLSLAVAGRGGIRPQLIREHTQQIHGGQRVLLGVATAEQYGTWQGMWSALGRGFVAIKDADVIVDLGRLGPDVPGQDLLPMASLVVLVAGTSPEEIAAVRDRAAALRERLGRDGGGAPIGILLVDHRRHHAKLLRELPQLLARQHLAVDVLGCLPFDASGAAQLAGRKTGRVEKSELVRAVRQVVDGLRGRYGLGVEPLAEGAEGVPADAVGVG